MHALLFRKWKGRIKGRDWFDLEWYIRRNIPLHLDHFLIRSIQSDDWTKETITKEEFLDLLIHKINRVSMDEIKDDIVRFIPDDKPLEIWSKNYFYDLVKHIRFTDE
jgi:hypothetical protein